MKNILLIGLGRFGRHAAMTFYERGQQVMAIDKDEERVNDVLPYVTNAQIGDATDEDFLRSLGVRNFDACLVTIGDDFQSSLETTSLLKEMGAPRVISRASRDIHAKFLLRNGADEVIYPEKEMAERTAVRCGADHILDYFELEDGYAIFEATVPEKWIGRNLIELNLRQKCGVTVLAKRTDGRFSAALSPTAPFEGGETVLLIGTDEDVHRCFGR